jgi:glycosyltransferase involved in cell wall biosynthesis
VPSVLLVIDGLEYGGAARQLCHLASLPAEGCRVSVVVLGRSAPWADALSAAGVAVTVLGRSRTFDLLPFLALRRLVRSEPFDAFHAWGRTALRALSLVARPRGPLVAGALLPPSGALSWHDRLLLRRVAGVLALGADEARRYRALGVADDRLVVANPAVAEDRGSRIEDRGSPDRSFDPRFSILDPQRRLVVGLGPLLPHKGFRDAVWALDILHYLYDDLHLALIGDGPERPRLEAFARAIGVAGRVSFLGRVADPGPLLRRAELVWVPSLAAAGVNAALEGMAAGKPVVAARLPALAEVVVDGQTGALFTPGDKPDLARRSRALLDRPDQARQLGEAGRLRAAELFSVAQLARACARLYATASPLRP